MIYCLLLTDKELCNISSKFPAIHTENGPNQLGQLPYNLLITHRKVWLSRQQFQVQLLPLRTNSIGLF